MGITSWIQAMKVLASLSLAATILATLANSAELRDGAGKLAIFQVVKFPNIPCEVTGGTKNGTCYTSEECSDGYGVCCIFSLGCGSTIAENCTYFESTGNNAV